MPPACSVQDLLDTSKAPTADSQANGPEQPNVPVLGVPQHTQSLPLRSALGASPAAKSYPTPIVPVSGAWHVMVRGRSKDSLHWVETAVCKCHMTTQQYLPRVAGTEEQRWLFLGHLKESRKTCAAVRTCRVPRVLSHARFMPPQGVFPALTTASWTEQY